MITIKKVIDYFHLKKYQIIVGDENDMDKEIVMPRAIQVANEHHLTFISNKFATDFLSLIQATKSLIILVEEQLINERDTESLPKGITYILSKNPKKDLIDFSNDFFKKKVAAETTIHPSANIAKDTSIGLHVYIGASVTIEENVIIGDRSIIGAGTVLKSNTIVGEDVIIGSCNVIGGDGFGYVKNDETGEYQHFPHYGGVVINNHVHIGNNTCIDRGSLKDTVIGNNVKIDNLVHIAHNVEIGKNSLIIACSMIAGSVIIGDNCWVAPSSTIRNAITIGKDVTIGLASTVTKSVADNEVVLGNPALPIDDFMVLRKDHKKIIENHRKNIQKNKS
ncbi:MAG: UDP-3-O-[3-hydroxymyristoyl] glucosamine N-acyltransferase [Psychroserpens sp.]|jgi:UDP-3-O-[3-hydroxymyristoyl] glucosamine N-acyltransferase